MSKLLIPGILQQQCNAQQGGGGGWLYEGIMTVGSFYGVMFGYSTNYGGFGSMSPANPQITGFNEMAWCAFDDVGNLIVKDNSTNPVCNFIEIDGIEYENSTSTIDVGGVNPFPSPGNTCTIKMR